MQESLVRSLGWEDPWGRERVPTPVFWPGEFRGLYSPRGHKESDSTEWLSLFFSFLSTFRSTWNLSFLTRDWTRVPCIGRQILFFFFFKNHFDFLKWFYLLYLFLAVLGQPPFLSGLFSSGGARASHWGGFFCRGAHATAKTQCSQKKKSSWGLYRLCSVLTPLMSPQH